MKVRILPFMEQTALTTPSTSTSAGIMTRRAARASRSTRRSSRRRSIRSSARPTPTPATPAPSRPRRGRSPPPATGTTRGPSATTTAACPTGPAWWLGGHSQIGIKVTLASVTDGTSNTAVFSEWVKGTAGQNKPGLNLCWNYSQGTQRGRGQPQPGGLAGLPGVDLDPVGLQGRVLVLPRRRPGRYVLAHQSPQHQVVRRRHLVGRARHRRSPTAAGSTCSSWTARSSSSRTASTT